MKLRRAAASPFVRKVLVCAHELGLADHIELMPTTVTPIQANDELAPENPLMKVPSLATDDGQALFDPPVICEYLDSLAGGGELFPAVGSARWAALRRQALGDGILDVVDVHLGRACRPGCAGVHGTIGQMHAIDDLVFCQVQPEILAVIR